MHEPVNLVLRIAGCRIEKAPQLRVVAVLGIHGEFSCRKSLLAYDVTKLLQFNVRDVVRHKFHLQICFHHDLDLAGGALYRPTCGRGGTILLRGKTPPGVCSGIARKLSGSYRSIGVMSRDFVSDSRPWTPVR